MEGFFCAVNFESYFNCLLISVLVLYLNDGIAIGICVEN